jgi:hypothetical protein
MARTFAFPWQQAQALSDELLEVGDELALGWRGEFLPPLLTRAGQGRRAIVVAVDRSANPELPPLQVRVALLDEGKLSS